MQLEVNNLTKVYSEKRGLLPSALSDFSHKLNKVAPILPSYQLFKPICSILLEGKNMSYFPLELVCLFFIGSLTFFLSYFLIKKTLADVIMGIILWYN
jgi:hypothetical protein